MSLTIPVQLLRRNFSRSPYLDRVLSRTPNHEEEVSLDADCLSAVELSLLGDLAGNEGHNKISRSITAILAFRCGDFSKPVPSFLAFESCLRSYLRKDVIDGWIYVKGKDGFFYPELVTGVDFHVKDYRNNKTFSVSIKTTFFGRHIEGHYSDQSGNHRAIDVRTKLHSFSPSDVSNRHIDKILQSIGIYKETPELKELYRSSMQRYEDGLRDGFSREMVCSGVDVGGASFRDQRVIHDLEQDDVAPYDSCSAPFFDESAMSGFSVVPVHPVIRIFHTPTENSSWIHAGHLSFYQYDLSLRDKLILPQTHRDLLDVLTEDIDILTSDIVDGKSAGNMILCAGQPGVGKTLTAEIYAELMQKPLYRVRCGSLGTSSNDIDKNLRRITARSQRWNCVLLLDEGDVFVAKRGDDIHRNAVVAEFLRVFEYFDSLIFITTNRPDDIDEAFFSRCAAIIHYDLPTSELAKEVWRVLTRHFHAEIDEGMIDLLVASFPEAAPRDIKMLLRLTIRMATSKKVPLSLELFRRCAMFRNMKAKQDK